MNDFDSQEQVHAVGSNLTSAQADQYALVLAAAGIDYRFRRSGWGWAVEVFEQDIDRARAEVAQFIRENPPSPVPVALAAEPAATHQGTATGVAAALLLLVFHAVTVRDGAHQSFIMAAGADAEAILNGEYWRTVTALTLHADARHLAGNMLAIAVFGALLCRRIGHGAAWLLILLAGAGGNLLNALLHQSGFLSIGASTAVFGAVGLLGGVRVFAHEFRHHPHRRAGSWLLPLGAALGLLAMLGSDVQSDIGAHLMGCVVGICLGIGFTIVAPRQLNERRQTHLLLLALGLLVASWWRVVEGG